jgi:actin-like ATPase involved in cell morphogenesis
MTAPSGYRLGVDFGTSTTIAMLQWPDGRVRPLLFDGSPLLSSAVLLGLDGRLYTGRDAEHLGRGTPERLEPNPKRRIDDGAVLLGGVEVPVVDLIAAVLRRVAVEAGQVAGEVGDVTLTHPAAWGAGRRGLLVEAAWRAGLGRPSLVSEPQAAATYLAKGGAGLPPGACVVIYDLGAGTCDATVLRRVPEGFQVVASDGLNEVGGLDVDAAIVAFLGAAYGQLWNDAISRRQVWAEVRTAKEMLSRASGTVVTLPALGREVPLGREQFEGLARPVLRPTTAMVKALLRETNIGAGTVAALFLVGGSSKIPLIGTLLHEALGVAPIVTEQPELVVAEGALHVTGHGSAAAGAAPVTGAPVGTAGLPGGMPAPPVPAGPGVPAGFAVPAGPGVPAGSAVPVGSPGRSSSKAQPGRAGRGLAATVAAGAVLLVLLGGTVGGYLWYNRASGSVDQRRGAGAGASGTPSSSAATAPLKYAASQLPQNLCDTIDVSALSAAFEKESGTPTAQRNLSTTVGTFNCSLAREHDVKAVMNSLATVNVIVSVYTDGKLAVLAHQMTFDNAKLNTPDTTAEIRGLGDHAYFYQQRGASDSDPNTTYMLEARDANVTWIVNFTASRLDGATWADGDRAQHKEQIITVLKASLAKFGGQVASTKSR